MNNLIQPIFLGNHAHWLPTGIFPELDFLTESNIVYCKWWRSVCLQQNELSLWSFRTKFVSSNLSHLKCLGSSWKWREYFTWTLVLFQVFPLTGNVMLDESLLLARPQFPYLWNQELNQIIFENSNSSIFRSKCKIRSNMKAHNQNSRRFRREIISEVSPPLPWNSWHWPRLW